MKKNNSMKVVVRKIATAIKITEAIQVRNKKARAVCFLSLAEVAAPEAKKNQPGTPCLKSSRKLESKNYGKKQDVTTIS